jgi:hypothetical protein
MDELARYRMFREYLTIRYPADTPLEIGRRIDDAENVLRDLPEDITKKVQLSRVLALHHLKYALSLVDDTKGQKLALQHCDSAVKILEQGCVNRIGDPRGARITVGEINDTNRMTWTALRIAYAMRAGRDQGTGGSTEAAWRGGSSLGKALSRT